MISFYEFLNEAFEKDIFEPHPDSSSPEGGSSHDVYRLRNKEGENFWSKSGISDLQTINEYLAWKIYKLFNINVANKAHLVVNNNNKLRLVSSQVGGKQVPLSYGSDLSYLKNTDIHKGFFVDAFVGHWDVVGNAPRSNLFIDDENRVARIDLGGLDFRATGPRKSKTIPGSWGSKVGELQTMGGIGGSPMQSTSSSVFGDIENRKESLKQSAELFLKVSWSDISKTLQDVLFEIKQISEEHNLPEVFKEANEYISEISSVLKDRFEDIREKISSMGLFEEWMKLSGIVVFNEEIATYDQIKDKETLYKTYYDAYSERGMKPWSKDDFEWRAVKWTFAGVLPKEDIPYEQIGFITAREKNGIYKLTGMQGRNTKAKIKGLLELANLQKPIWGAMDKDFTLRLKKMGFMTPPRKIMKFLLPIIQSDSQFSSGGSWGELSDDGGINFDLSGVGQTTKYFTANRQFYKYLMEKLISKGKINENMLKLLKKWKSMPQMLKGMSLKMMPIPNNVDLDVESVDWLADLID